MAHRRSRRETPQRRTILAELRRSHDHPTAAELFAAVRRELPRISLGTVYRNLAVLHDEGAIRKLELAGSEARFDATLTPHGHVRCSHCGRVQDVHRQQLPAIPPELSDFIIESQNLEYVGICPTCRDDRR